MDITKFLKRDYAFIVEIRILGKFSPQQSIRHLAVESIDHWRISGHSSLILINFTQIVSKENDSLLFLNFFQSLFIIKLYYYT